MIRLICAALLLAAPALAQQTPMPFAPSKETRQISVEVTQGRSSMRGLPRDLREARRMMLDRQEIPDSSMRRLADRGDGLAAQRYVRRLVAQGEMEAQASDVAYYAAIAVGTGRVWTLPQMIEAMGHLSAKTEPRARIRKYIQVLYPHAWAGNTIALQAVVDFNGEGRLFGALSDSTREKIVSHSGKAGDGMIPLRMALVLMEKHEMTKDETAEARRLLDSARQTTHPGIRATAEAMMRQLDLRQATAG